MWNAAEHRPYGVPGSLAWIVYRAAGFRSMLVAHTHRSVLRLIPTPVVTFLARVHRPLARYLVARRYQGGPGGRLIRTVDPDDDLVHYGMRQLAEKGSAFRYYHSLELYYDGGERNVSEIESILAALGAPLADAGSILEFACGSGRLTRHLVRRVSPAKLTVSDIDRHAVDFVTRTFGVRGLYSTSEPEELVHDARYDLILVVSLFSHLPIQTWTRWLERLNELLMPQGLLVFSTLPWQAGESPPIPEQTEAFELGLLYSEQNETRGRLSGNEYGTSFVRTQFVLGAVEEHFKGRLVKHLPRALNGVQDVYVLQRESE
jgi:2-polyprenyl-3-methyl-5-hydroxy-6-metoxy-1,4-benzoquinol methylase